MANFPIKGEFAITDCQALCYDVQVDFTPGTLVTLLTIPTNVTGLTVCNIEIRFVSGTMPASVSFELAGVPWLSNVAGVNLIGAQQYTRVGGISGVVFSYGTGNDVFGIVPASANVGVVGVTVFGNYF